MLTIAMTTALHEHKLISWSLYSNVHIALQHRPDHSSQPTHTRGECATVKPTAQFTTEGSIQCFDIGYCCVQCI